MVDPVDEYAVQQLKEFRWQAVKVGHKEGLDIDDEDEKKKLEELKAEFEPLSKHVTEARAGKVGKSLVPEWRTRHAC